ncbi:phage terminase small subunit P27 family [Diplocloster agilis]|uniref:phage terminase small subunit P27 family n=1 Tax=Diplocloster agilis TaxID=2850323 RepID=UPI000822C464|nr:phage terminase small subunit P27 family [Suonthocola fibrivorans]MCU6734936.1 phage terminase small subunit P27 family [Suonthocola fibrivorans]SCJ59351.1 Phage terminase%2C small subunit [uncultured Clostridium sp.]
MSRNRKPLDQQAGNITKEDKDRKALEEQVVKTGAEDIGKTPAWLVDAVAKREYKRILKDLKRIEIVGNLDLSNLAGYCNAYAMYRKATQQLANEELIVKRTSAQGYEYEAENPLIVVQKKYAEEMRKFASLCGMTIDSRLKAATMKVDKIEDEIEDEFGDI